MAIGTKFVLKDGISGTINKIVTSINTLMNTTDQMVDRANRNFNTFDKSLNNVNNHLGTIEKSGKKMTKGIGLVNTTLINMQREIRESNKVFMELMKNASKGIPNTRINIEIPNKNGVLGFIGRVKSSLVDLSRYGFGLYIAFQGLQRFTNYFDKIIGIDARLNLITNTESEKTAFKKRLIDTANNLGLNVNDFSGTVIKMKQLSGGTFSSNEEALRFNELMAKSFRVNGTSSQESASALYQLTQAMASNRLQGDEFRTIIENAPILAQAIAKKMDVPFGRLKDLGRQGKITANIIKQSMFDIAETIDSQFERIPRTWSQLFNIMFNKMQEVLIPILNAINRISNNQNIIRFLNYITPRLKIIASVIGSIFNIALNGLDKLITFLIPILKFINNFSGVIYGVVGAMLTYKATLLATMFLTNAYNIAVSVLTFLKGGLGLVVAVLTGKFAALNSVMWANPIGLVIGLIVLLIGVVQTVIHFYNKWAGTSHTLTGVLIGGIVAVASHFINGVLFIYNSIMGLLNGLINISGSIIEVIYNMFVSPFNAIKNFVLDSINFILGAFKRVAKFADSFLGTNMANKVNNWQIGLENKKSYTDGMIKLGKSPIHEVEYLKTNKIFHNFKGIGDTAQNNFMNKLFPKNNINDFVSKDNNTLNEMNENLQKINNNTSDTKDNTSYFKEDLKLLRDMANKEYIASVTSPNITLEVVNNNNINNKEDAQSIIDMLTEQVQLAVQGGLVKGVVR